MKSRIRIAASRVGFAAAPADARPYGNSFSLDAAKKYGEDSLARSLATFRTAGEAGADVVVSTEYALHFGDFGSLENQKHLRKLVQEIPGPATDKTAEIAKEYGMHIALNMQERVGGDVMNTTVLIGRDGKIIGKYRKIHMPAFEHWFTKAGTEYNVFETDIGRIGFTICHDMAFPESVRGMALNGADIVLHATGGWGFVTNYTLGKALLQVRAAENCVHIANSYLINPTVPGSSSCIVSNKGVVLAENDSQTEDGIAIAEIDPDYEMINDNSMWNFFCNVRSERMRFMLERNPVAYGVFAEASPPVSRDCFPKYKYARTRDEIASMSETYDNARREEESGVSSELFRGKEW